MNGKAAVRPSPWYYALAAPFVVAGIVIFVYSLLHGLLHLTDGLTQVVVPGEAKLVFKQQMEYTVFLERHSVFNGKIYDTSASISGLDCNLVPESGLQKIWMRPSTATTTYDLGARSGRSIFQFRVPADGTYSFGCGYNTGRGTGPEVVVAVGSGVGADITRTIFFGIGGVFGGGIGAAAIIVIVFVLRQRSKRTSSRLAPLS